MPLDVVHRHAGLARVALDEVGDGGALEDGAGRRGGLAEDALGVAAERAVEELDDLERSDLGRVAGEAVAALDAALRGEDAGAAQRGEELLEELDRDVATTGELADRDGAVAAGAAELGQRLERVRALRGDRQHASGDYGRADRGSPPAWTLHCSLSASSSDCSSSATARRSCGATSAATDSPGPPGSSSPSACGRGG